MKMSKNPRLLIDLKKIEHNTREISKLASKHGISITGVTKCTCGDPQVAAAMLRGGAVSLADSRIQNLKQLRKFDFGVDLMLLRTPMLSETEDVVKYADISLNSELSVISSLANEAKKQKKTHRITLIVEMGDLREGIPQDQLEKVLDQVIKLNGIELYAFGMNLACYAGVVPTNKKINEFLKIVSSIEKKFGIEFKMITGGNSANIPFLMNTNQSSRINNLRIGEGILLGLETVDRKPIPGTYQDAFVLECEIIELNIKSSVPDGEISQNAFGETPKFVDHGMIRRGILAIGRQDVIVEGLKPLDDKIQLLGSGSDHVIVKIDSAYYKVGDTVKFLMDYGGLLHLNTSKYVEKEYLN